MKKTENISLAGYAFTIEAEAYEELAAYLKDIKEAFRSDANAEEITADIEERIAELLREKCITGMVVDTTMVRNIRQLIGNPKQLAQEDTDQTFEEDKAEQVKEPAQDKKTDRKSWKTRRMFRNMDEKVLGGVCSGLGTYFGVDKVLFRIGFVIFTVLPFIGHWGIVQLGLLPIPFLYCALWIAMPAARTDDQKREMKGKPTNLESYRNSDFDFKTEVKEAAQSPAGQTAKRAGGIFLGTLLLVIGLVGMIGCAIIPSAQSLISHEIAEEITDWGPLDAEEQFIADLLTCNDTFWVMILVIVGLLFIWFLYNGIMLIFGLKYPSWKPGLIIFISWVISIFVFAGYVAKLTADSLGTLLISL